MKKKTQNNDGNLNHVLRGLGLEDNNFLAGLFKCRRMILCFEIRRFNKTLRSEEVQSP